MTYGRVLVYRGSTYCSSTLERIAQVGFLLFLMFNSKIVFENDHENASSRSGSWKIFNSWRGYEMWKNMWNRTWKGTQTQLRKIGKQDNVVYRKRLCKIGWLEKYLLIIAALIYCNRYVNHLIFCSTPNMTRIFFVLEINWFCY